MCKGPRFPNAKQVGRAIRLNLEMRFKTWMAYIKTSLRWADSELLLGQPVQFNLAPYRIPEDHVDIEVQGY